MLPHPFFGKAIPFVCKLEKGFAILSGRSFCRPGTSLPRFLAMPLHAILDVLHGLTPRQSHHIAAKIFGNAPTVKPLIEGGTRA
jgi:hypothetical protein